MTDTIKAIFEAEDLADLKERLKQLILEQMNQDLTDFRTSSYICDPKFIEEIFEDAMEEVKEEMKVAIKERLLPRMMARVDQSFPTE